MHAVYWIWIHPTNPYWLRSAEVKLGNVGGSFFALDPGGQSGASRDVDWTKFRDRWEYSHLIRAGSGFVSFVALILAAFARG
jgi:hypothetical protein